MTRTRRWSLLLCFLAGCSTHPLVDFCDLVKPGKLGPNKVPPYGGVGIPQGAIVPVAGPVGAEPGPTFPGGGVIPGPAPLPGGAGPTTLQPPIPPPPPPRPF